MLRMRSRKVGSSPPANRAGHRPACFIRLIDRYVRTGVEELAAHPAPLGFNIPAGRRPIARGWLRRLSCVCVKTARHDYADSRDHRNRGAPRYRGIGPVRAAVRDAGCSVGCSRILVPGTSRRKHAEAWPSIPSKMTVVHPQSRRSNPEKQVFLRHLLGLAKVCLRARAECVATRKSGDPAARRSLGTVCEVIIRRPFAQTPGLRHSGHPRPCRGHVLQPTRRV